MYKTIGFGFLFILLCWILFEIVSAKDAGQLWSDWNEDDEQTKE